MSTTPNTRRHWIAVDVPAAAVDDHLGAALTHAADRAETVLTEERGYEATAWHAVENRPANGEQQHAAVEEPAAPLTATAALYEAMRRIDDAPQDYELDPGRGDALATLRALLAETEGKAQQRDDDDVETLKAAFLEAGKTMQAENETLRARLAAVERLCSGRPGYHTITVKALLTAMSEAAEDDGLVPYHGEHGYPEGEAPEEQPAAAEEPPTPRIGDRYVKRAAPDAGRTVTVTRVWTADAGHTAVAYEWRDDKPGAIGSACPLDVFHRTYAEAQR